MSSDHGWTRSWDTSADGMSHRLYAAVNACKVQKRHHPQLEDIEATLRGLLAAMHGGPRAGRDGCVAALTAVRAVLKDAPDGDRRELADVHAVLAEIVGQCESLDACSVEVRP